MSRFNIILLATRANTASISEHNYYLLFQQLLLKLTKFYLSSYVQNAKRTHKKYSRTSA